MRVFVGLIALTEAGKCEDKGGQCVDWRTEVSFMLPSDLSFKGDRA